MYVAEHFLTSSIGVSSTNMKLRLVTKTHMCQPICANPSDVPVAETSALSGFSSRLATYIREYCIGQDMMHKANKLCTKNDVLLA